jgi:hypothetical protein
MGLRHVPLGGFVNVVDAGGLPSEPHVSGIDVVQSAVVISTMPSAQGGCMSGRKFASRLRSYNPSMSPSALICVAI